VAYRTSLEEQPLGYSRPHSSPRSPLSGVELSRSFLHCFFAIHFLWWLTVASSYPSTLARPSMATRPTVPAPPVFDGDEATAYQWLVTMKRYISQAARSKYEDMHEDANSIMFFTSSIAHPPTEQRIKELQVSETEKVKVNSFSKLCDWFLENVAPAQYGAVPEDKEVKLLAFEQVISSFQLASPAAKAELVAHPTMAGVKVPRYVIFALDIDRTAARLPSEHRNVSMVRVVFNALPQPMQDIVGSEHGDFRSLTAKILTIKPEQLSSWIKLEQVTRELQSLKSTGRSYSAPALPSSASVPSSSLPASRPSAAAPRFGSRNQYAWAIDSAHPPTRDCGRTYTVARRAEYERDAGAWYRHRQPASPNNQFPLQPGSSELGSRECHSCGAANWSRDHSCASDAPQLNELERFIRREVAKGFSRRNRPAALPRFFIDEAAEGSLSPDSSRDAQGWQHRRRLMPTSRLSRPHFRGVLDTGTKATSSIPRNETYILIAAAQDASCDSERESSPESAASPGFHTTLETPATSREPTPAPAAVCTAPAAAIVVATPPPPPSADQDIAEEAAPRRLRVHVGPHRPESVRVSPDATIDDCGAESDDEDEDIGDESEVEPAIAHQAHAQPAPPTSKAPSGTAYKLNSWTRGFQPAGPSKLFRARFTIGKAIKSKVCGDTFVPLRTAIADSGYVAERQGQTDAEKVARGTARAPPRWPPQEPRKGHRRAAHHKNRHRDRQEGRARRSPLRPAHRRGRAHVRSCQRGAGRGHPRDEKSATTLEERRADLVKRRANNDDHVRKLDGEERRVNVRFAGFDSNLIVLP
jgi:hypothetical protein